MTKVFIDGSAGTTGLRIHERLAAREDIELLTLTEEFRKDEAARREIINKADIVYLCLPDDAAKQAVTFVNGNTRVIDTSTAHRTDSGFVYGMPELNGLRDKIKNAQFVANPGCHASGFIALIAPLIESGALDRSARLSCTSITGYSGGGKKMIAEYETDKGAELYSPRIYALTQSHKHLPEMVALCKLKNKPIFSPIVDDYYSGMLLTVPFFASQIKGGLAAVKETYKKKYGNCKFIDVSGIDSNEGAILGSNNLSGRDIMQIFVEGNEERFTVSARYDNLGKGASGAAVECMNIMLGVDETTGLDL